MTTPGDEQPGRADATPNPAAGGQGQKKGVGRSVAAEAGATAAQAATTAAVSAAATPLAGKAAGAVVGKAARSQTGQKVIVTSVVLVTFLVVATGFLAMAIVTTIVGSVAQTANNAAAALSGGNGGCHSGMLDIEDADSIGELTSEQTLNFTAIMQEVSDRRLPPADAIIAVMTAITESSLNNVEHGDLAGPDSRGLFQQRDPWGPLEVRMDPAGATGLFLDSLANPDLKVYGTSESVNATETSRYEMPPWLVAQSVQRSAYSNGENYRKNYEMAAALVGSIVGQERLSQAGVDHWSRVDVDGSQIAENVLEEGLNDAQDPLGLGNGSNDPLDPDPIDGSDLEGENDDEFTIGDLLPTACTGTAAIGSNVNFEGPGQWGGHENGRIPAAALAPLPWSSGHSLRADAAAAAAAMNEAYREHFGTDISVTDSYRDYDRQVVLKRQKGHMAATPGYSNHGWGLALDLGGGINSWFSSTHQWMAQNAPSYGWVNPEWAQPGQGKEEPWHWEFVGVEDLPG